MKVCWLASSIVTYLGPWTSFSLMVITFIYFQLSLNWPRVSFTLKIDGVFFFFMNSINKNSTRERCFSSCHKGETQEKF